MYECRGFILLYIALYINVYGSTLWLKQRNIVCVLYMAILGLICCHSRYCIKGLNINELYWYCLSPFTKKDETRQHSISVSP